jgi:calmodulin
MTESLNNTLNSTVVGDEITDPEFHQTVGLIRKMSTPNLKEQCLRTEWAALETEAERKLLLQVCVEEDFWREVKAMTAADMETVPEEEDEVDTNSRLLQMFECFDKDKSGTIDANELHQMLLYMGVSATDKEVKEMIRQVDKNGDGSIDRDEFLNVMKAAQSGQLSISAPSKGSIRRASIKLQNHQIKRTTSGGFNVQ